MEYDTSDSLYKRAPKSPTKTSDKPVEYFQWHANFCGEVKKCDFMFWYGGVSTTGDNCWWYMDAVCIRWNYKLVPRGLQSVFDSNIVTSDTEKFASETGPICSQQPGYPQRPAVNEFRSSWNA